MNYSYLEQFSGHLAAILNLQLIWLLNKIYFGDFFDSLTPKHGSRHQTYNSEANNNRNMTILSNLAAILAGILATILGFQPTWLFRRFNLVTLDFLTQKILV